VKILVLSNVNVAPLAGRVAEHDVDVGEYGDVLRALADPSSAAFATDLEVLVVLMDGDELVGAGALADELPTALAAAASARPDLLVVAATVAPDPATVRSYGEALDPSGTLARAARFNDAVRELAVEHSNVAVLDVALVFDRLGREQAMAPTYWYAGRIPYSAAWFAACGEHLGGLLDAHRSRARKVLVCDLDNTLWGGVLGEEGPGGIALGEDGAGKCYRDLQREIRALQETGVLLAIASKNDAGLVEEVLAEHPMMILRAADFAATRVDWGDKAANIAAIADELSLGLDAFVLLDDNPVERALVAEVLPDVAVPELPERPELLARWFVRDVVFPYFPKLRVLDADRAKTESYRARSERARTEATATDLTSFLQGLEIQLDLRVDDEYLVERAAQMTQKTNQFNLTTRRCTPGEIQAMVDDDRHAVVTVGYTDRFGDEGVVGLAVLDGDDGSLPLFLLSCRVIGRGVEDALVEHVEGIARSRGIGALTCTFVPTDRNGVAADFLPRRGWTASAEADGAIVYREELA
jgi:FkbH-like protein